MVSTLPIALKNLPVLLIGAGNVALQKASVLYDNAIPFHVVSQEVSEKMKTFTPHIKKHPFKKKDVEGFMIIIDATGNSEVTETLLEAKKETNFLLNVVDKPDQCDFYFMALTPNAPLQIAVSSRGYSPTAAQFFRDICQKQLPSFLDLYLEKNVQRE